MNEDAVVPFFDGDTNRILRISRSFLQQYFGYSADKAHVLVQSFFSKYSPRYDEDVVHHESAYRMAAIIHYVEGMGGGVEEVGNWLVSSGHHQVPRDALMYFKEHYFVK